MHFNVHDIKTDFPKLGHIYHLQTYCKSCPWYTNICMQKNACTIVVVQLAFGGLSITSHYIHSLIFNSIEKFKIFAIIRQYLASRHSYIPGVTLTCHRVQGLTVSRVVLAL